MSVGFTSSTIWERSRFLLALSLASLSALALAICSARDSAGLAPASSYVVGGR